MSINKEMLDEQTSEIAWRSTPGHNSYQKQMTASRKSSGRRNQFDQGAEGGEGNQCHARPKRISPSEYDPMSEGATGINPNPEN
jgi:hypothetical protein